MREDKQGPCQGATTKNHSPQIIAPQPRIIKGRAQAIALHCKSCIYDPMGGNGTWREQTKNCTSFGCALWKFRPLPGSRVVDEVINPADESSDFHGGSDHQVSEG